MPIRFDGTTARFEGDCTVEEALPLAEWLTATPDGLLDLGTCTALHTAVLQVLMAAGRPVTTTPADPFLARWVIPAIG
ncbi:hypothetical protein [Azospirillum halopraeferens]|uniref:hypothetical protein n=1 Tax=Azospirillum halopraeferens TaxID=34010 RepID=UPI000423D35E|nr:hypothetical protein [Azospirillum halopraeferens]